MCLLDNLPCLEIRTKRIYEPPESSDGYRLLVDRLWPRGVSKARVSLDSWMKEIGPSSELRRWFGHDVLRWCEFKRRYHAKLEASQPLVNQILSIASERPLTLLYSARDPDHNQAIALAEHLNMQNFQLGAMNRHALLELRRLTVCLVLFMLMFGSAIAPAANASDHISQNGFVVSDVALGMRLEQVLKIYPTSVVERKVANRYRCGQRINLPELTRRVLRYKDDEGELTMSFEPPVSGGGLSRIHYEHSIDQSNLDTRTVIDGLISQYGPYDRVLYRRKMEPAGRIVGFDWYSSNGATLRVVLRDNHHKSSDSLSLSFLARSTSRKTQPILKSLPVPCESGTKSSALEQACSQSQLEELFNPSRMHVTVYSQLKRRTSCL